MTPKKYFKRILINFISITFAFMENKNPKLYMIMLGATPDGRLTEQHDIFFGIGTSLKELIPDMNAFWPEANGKIHIDCWREVTSVDGYSIEITSREAIIESSEKLFFLNLGGYKENEFEEYHYKLLSVSKNLSLASKKSKQTAFFKHFNFKNENSKGGVAHIDDKYGIDIDDAFNVQDLLSDRYKEKYQLKISPSEGIEEDILHIGYVKISSLK